MLTKNKYQSENNFFYYYLYRCMMLSMYVFCFLLVWKRLLSVFRKTVFIGLGCNIQARKKV